MTIKVKKGLEVPVLFTAETWLRYGRECDILPTDLFVSLLDANHQLPRLSVLFHSAIHSAYEDLGEPMPYTLDEVSKWFFTKNSLNFALLTSVSTLAREDYIKSIKEAYDEDEDEEVGAEDDTTEKKTNP